MMRTVSRRATFLLLILALLIVPAANAWCSTVCLAAAISSGCAHGLQPTDDLPVSKAAPPVTVAFWTGISVSEVRTEAPVYRAADVPARMTPLRI